MIEVGEEPFFFGPHIWGIRGESEIITVIGEFYFCSMFCCVDHCQFCASVPEMKSMRERKKKLFYLNPFLLFLGILRKKREEGGGGGQMMNKNKSGIRGWT